MARQPENLPGLGLRTLAPRLMGGVSLARLRLNHNEAYVLSRIDGKTTLWEVCLLVPLERELTLDILRWLRMEGLIDVPGSAEPLPQVKRRDMPAPAARTGSTPVPAKPAPAAPAPAIAAPAPSAPAIVAAPAKRTPAPASAAASQESEDPYASMSGLSVALSLESQDAPAAASPLSPSMLVAASLPFDHELDGPPAQVAAPGPAARPGNGEGADDRPLPPLVIESDGDIGADPFIPGASFLRGEGLGAPEAPPPAVEAALGLELERGAEPEPELLLDGPVDAAAEPPVQPVLLEAGLMLEVELEAQPEPEQEQKLASDLQAEIDAELLPFLREPARDPTPEVEVILRSRASAGLTDDTRSRRRGDSSTPPQAHESSRPPFAERSSFSAPRRPVSGQGNLSREQQPDAAAISRGAPARSLAPLSFSAPAVMDEVPLDMTAEQQQRVDALYNQINATDAFTLLGVTPSDDKKVIQRAYFRLSKEFHPDRYFKKRIGIYVQRVAAIFQAITEARDTLVDEERRSAYLASGGPPKT